MLALYIGSCVGAFAGNSRTLGGAGPLLSYIMKGRAKYQWIFWNTSSRQKEVFLELPQAPELIFWDTREMRVYYAVGPRIFAAAYPKGPAAPSAIALLPRGDVQVLWMESTSGRLRVVELEEIPDDAITKGADRTVTYRLHDGSSVPGSDFPEGIPAVCTVLELDRNGKWLFVGRRATKIGAGEAPGLDVVHDLRHERGASKDSLLLSYAYAHAKIRGETLPKNLIPRLRRAGNYSVDDFVYVPEVNGLAGLVFSTVTGDTVHAETPVFLAPHDHRSLRRIQLRNRHQPIALGRNDRYLLIADEYSGDDPTVIDLETSKTLLSEHGSASVWVPR